jgi:hypothetical protein
MEIIATNFPVLEHVGLRSTLHETPEEFIHLTKLTSLSRISIQNTLVTSRGMESFCQLTRLTHISLISTPQTDVTVAMIGNLRNLEMMKISSRHSGYAESPTYATLVGLPKLRLLRIEGRVENMNLFFRRVSELPSLTDLSVSPAELNDEDVMYMLSLSRLTRLYMDSSATNISTEGMREFLKKMPQLKYLHTSAADQPHELALSYLREEFPNLELSISPKLVEVDDPFM